MAFAYQCPACQAKLTAEPDQTGETVPCSQCQAKLIVPDQSENPAAVPLATVAPPLTGLAACKAWYHRPGVVQIGIKVLLGLAIIVVGYKYGIGPLIFAMRGEQVQLVVENASDDMLDASFSYRMLSDRMAPRGRCEFLLPIGMPESHGLKLTNVRTGEVHKYRLALRPGQRLLFNPDGKITYFVVNDALAKTLVAPLTPELAGQLSRLEPPTAHEAQRAAMLQLAQQAIVKTVTDTMIPLDDYRFFSQSQGQRPNDAQLPRLLRTQVDLNLANGGVRFDPHTSTFLDGWLTIPADLKIPVTAGLEATLTAGQRLTLPAIYGNNQTYITFANPEEIVDYFGESFKMQWNYVYRHLPTVPVAMTFSGRGTSTANAKIVMTVSRTDQAEAVVKITGR
jgi:DNA-directed RNA polymerase subunit RPC12/RpoP